MPRLSWHCRSIRQASRPSAFVGITIGYRRRRVAPSVCSWVSGPARLTQTVGTENDCMKTSVPRWQIVQRRLKWTPYVACLMGATAAVLGVWVPFYAGSLGLPAGPGAAGFLIHWREIRRRRGGFISDANLPLILACTIGMSWVPNELGCTIMALNGARCCALGVCAFAALITIFRSRWARDLGVYAS